MCLKNIFCNTSRNHINFQKYRDQPTSKPSMTNLKKVWRCYFSLHYHNECFKKAECTHITENITIPFIIGKNHLTHTMYN